MQHHDTTQGRTTDVLVVGAGQVGLTMAEEAPLREYLETFFLLKKRPVVEPA